MPKSPLKKIAKHTEVKIDYKPNPKQELLHNIPVKQIFYGGAAGGGKILADNGVILTPFGWKKGIDLKVGDIVCHCSGKPQKIVQIHPRVTLEKWIVEFSDGTKTEVASDHLWTAWKGRKGRKIGNSRVFGEQTAEVVETRTLKKWLERGYNPQIPANGEILFNRTSRWGQQIDPYLLGVLLGDGCITTKQPFITCDENDKPHYRAILGEIDVTYASKGTIKFIGSLRKSIVSALKHHRLLGKKAETKHIPNIFKWGSIETRYSILQGLMDTDGYSSPEKNACYFYSVSKQLADDVAFIVRSLGGLATITKNPSSYKKDGVKIGCLDCYDVYIRHPDPDRLFRMVRKQHGMFRKNLVQKRVSSVYVDGEITGRCITVSNPDGLYITNDFIVTHNSYSLRWDAILFCLKNPGMEAYLFRRTYNMLEDNHIRPIQREVPIELGQYLPSKGQFVFQNGSRILFCHCEHTNDYLNYQGAEMHWLGIDEASLMEPIQIIELRGRVRLGSFTDKIVDKEFLPRVVMTSNPGGPSHNLLKRTIVAKSKPMTVFYDDTMKDPDDPEDKGWETIFIPARMADNPKLDKGYGSVFSAMSPERARALREGDWDAVEGAALHSLSKARHMVKKFKIPPYWTRFMCIDWGTAKPFSVGWYAVASEDVVINNNPHLPFTDKNPNRGIFIPKGAIIRYDEYYGWNGEENTGLRLDSSTVARNIVAREKDRKEMPMDYRVGDSAMWAQFDGPSPAERMMDATSGLITLQKAKKDRVANYNEILARLAGNPYLFKNGKIEEHPLFFITENCIHAWRTLPVLSSDKTDPDKGPDTNQEDHVYDEISYSLRSRPILSTEEDRWMEDYHAYKDSINSHKEGDPYAT